jgi:hypothetical protein
MISLLDPNNKLNEHKNSLTVTYPKTVNIIFGHYPYPEDIHNLIIDIKNNIDKDLTNYTNVKGGMTSWDFFINKPIFDKFITYVINKNQVSFPELFEHFYSKHTIFEAWGNEIKKGDSLDYHDHPMYHGILYLTKGCDLILPELNIKITPNVGDYYIFPANVFHGFNEYTGENNRYSLVFNITRNKGFKYNLNIKELNERKNS